jgi:hypothetical protein
MKPILAVLMSFVFACSAPPSTTRAGEDVATSNAALRTLGDGSYDVSVCGLHFDHHVELRSADGKLCVISPDAAFGKPPTLAIPVDAEGAFTVVDYRAQDGGQVHTISGRIRIERNIVSLHYRVSWDSFDVTHGTGAPRISTRIEGEGDGTFNLVSNGSSTCTVQHS